jgi:hypothetical protein
MKEVPLARTDVKISLRRLLPVAGGLLTPFVLMPPSWAEAIVEAAEWIGNGHVMALAAAANALTIIP